jgi:hypothetical protein
MDRLSVEIDICDYRQMMVELHPHKYPVLQGGPQLFLALSKRGPQGHHPFTPGDAAYIGAVFELVIESLGHGSLQLFVQNELHRHDIPSLIALQSCPQAYRPRSFRLKSPPSEGVPYSPQHQRTGQGADPHRVPLSPPTC